MAHYKTKSPDGKAQWVRVHERLSQMQIGDILTYEELKDLVGTSDLTAARQAQFHAARKLLLSHKRTTDNVRGEGYRIVDPKEQIGMSVSRSVRARRQQDQATDLIVHIDTTCLTPEEKQKSNDILRYQLARQEFLNRRSYNDGPIFVTNPPVSVASDLDERLRALESRFQK